MSETAISEESRKPDPVIQIKRFMDPFVPGDNVHDCGYKFKQHGWIDHGDHGHTVCPWSWLEESSVYINKEIS